jgi:hypothetical protein
MIGEVRFLPLNHVSLKNITCDQNTYPSVGGLSSIDLCSFDNLDGSRKAFLNFTVFSTRSFDLNERLNMAAVRLRSDFVEIGVS